MAITNIHEINKTIAPTTLRTTITPEQAAKLLERNEHNRKFSPNAVKFRQLCRALQRGEWQFNGDAIRIDWNGRLIDGQHRLQAVIATGIRIDTLLVEGLNPASQTTMDTGKARSLKDFLSMRGEKHYVALASVTAKMCAIDNHGMRAAWSSTSFVPTIDEQLRYLETHPSLRDSASKATRLYNSSRTLPVAVSGPLIEVFTRMDHEDSDYFWARLGDGVGLPDGHPVIVLRASLKRLKENTRGTRNQAYMAAITVKAWNKYRRGETIGGLNYRAGGANPEKFPEVI